MNGIAVAPVPRPADCELDWGQAFGVSATGAASRLCVGDTVAMPPGTTPVIAYGTAWQAGGFRCESRTDGMRCTAPSGRGFFISRGRQDFFWRPVRGPSLTR